MNIHQTSTAAFPQILTEAVADLKVRLQQSYEQSYPQLGEIIHLVLEEEEANAWKLSFPHLFLPDLVEAHVERLNLRPNLAGKTESKASRSFSGRPAESCFAFDQAA